MVASSASRDPGPPPRGGLALGLAGLAALLASSCCVAPLVLALVGISGAWIGQLRRVEPYSPWLMGVALGALAVAAWSLYRRPRAGGAECALDDPSSSCGPLRRTARRWFWFVAVLTLVPLVVPAMAPWFY